VATAAPAPPEELKRARNRVRGRQEWRQLRRMTGGRSADRPEGCNACRPERDKDDKEPPVRQRSPAGCGALSQAFSGLSLVLVGLVIAALVGLLIWAIVKYSGDKDDDGKDADFGDETGLALSPRTPPGERPASVYLKRALSLAEAGDFRGALRQLLLGAMSWTERKNLIRFRQGLTNRDYLRALRRRPTQRQGLQAVVVEFEKVYFGRRPATAARFERVLPGYRHGFEGGDDRLDESDDRDRDDRDGTDDQVRSGGGGAGRPGEQGGGAAAAPAAPGT
jgi:hypothetical protein